ncbi:unnamed protein product, partial [Vitis vinifera]
MPCGTKRYFISNFNFFLIENIITKTKRKKREPPNPQTHLTPLRSPLISHSVRVSGQHLHRRRTLRRHSLPHSHSPQVISF